MKAYANVSNRQVKEYNKYKWVSSLAHNFNAMELGHPKRQSRQYSLYLSCDPKNFVK